MTLLAIVTGGTRGLGAAISENLANLGFRVVAVYAANEVAANIFRRRTGCVIRRWDVSSALQCAEGVAELEQEFGPCAVLINNAGVTSDATLGKLDPTQWRKVIDTNLGGCFNMTRVVFPGMRAASFGRLIHISSVVSQVGGFGISNYSASKAAIEGFSRAIALEGAKYGITSNVVSPGFINVGMVESLPRKMAGELCMRIPLGRFGEADEVVHAVNFLIDSRAGYITGSRLMVNGGLFMD